MLNIHNLAISFQGEFLFRDISFHLKKGDRVGLIGKNGAGKSTLLRILNNDLETDLGQIASDKNLKIGFLKQLIIDEVSLKKIKNSSDIEEFINQLRPFYPGLIIKEYTIEEIERQLTETYIKIMGKILQYVPESIVYFL